MPELAACLPSRSTSLMHDSLLQRLTPIFQDVFSNPALRITEGMTARDVTGWDSFAHIHLMMEIERSFGIKFTTKELGELSRVADLIRILEARQGGQA